jgi:hypothetical protein
MVLRGIGWSLKSVEKYKEGYQGYAWRIILKTTLSVIGGETLNLKGNIKIDLEIRHAVDVTYDTFSHPVFR